MILIIKQYDYACLYSPVSQFRKTLLCRDKNIIGAPKFKIIFHFSKSDKMKQKNSPILLLQYKKKDQFDSTIIISHF